MPPRTWDHFGGRAEGQQGYRPSEDALNQFAEGAGFTSVQAQALLCSKDMYPASYRKRLELCKEVMASAVQKHNKLSKSRRLPGGEQQQVVTMAKFQLNPMHLLVQQAYFSAKVSSLFSCHANTWLHWQICCQKELNGTAKCRNNFLTKRLGFMTIFSLPLRIRRSSSHSI